MRFLLNLLILALLGSTATVRAANTQARLVLGADVAPPGETVTAGIELRMNPHWHTYWRNPGVSGMETKVNWELPPGIVAGEILWPLPSKLPPDEFLTYIYENETLLLVRLKLAPDLKPGVYPIKAKVTWLECDESCIQASADIHGTLTVGNELKPSGDSALIQQWEKKLPLTNAQVSANAWWEKSDKENVRFLIIEWSSTNASSEVDFFPDKDENFEVQGATGRLPADSGKNRIRKEVKKLEGDWPKQVSGVLVQKSGADRTGFEVTLTPTFKSVPSADTTTSTPVDSLWIMLLKAFVGGLILNVMPCVLPVISLKIVGFVREAHGDTRHVRTLGLLYTAGVLASFLVLAGIVILVRVAGHRVAWGMQFGNPFFLLAMATLLTLISLNLFGLFEVSLGGRTMNAAASLSSKSGKPGAFFNGLLATVLATSCTAPLLAPAVGYAFTQPPIFVVLMMLTIGVGLAAPYLLLSWQPAWLTFVPKPGAWMEKFKIAMGFTMLGATVWVCSLLTTHYGDRAWDFAIFLLFVAGAAWIYGQFIQRGRRHRGFAAVAAALLLVVGYIYALEWDMKWREPIKAEAIKASAQASELSSVSPAGAEWKPWSAAAVSDAQAAGHPVVVDFTAKWCLTCQKNIKPVLGSQSVQSRMEQLNAVGLVGDYTRYPEDITEELNRHGRAGVPLVLVFPGKSGAPPIVLPAGLTSGMVVDALTKAAAL